MSSEEPTRLEIEAPSVAEAIEQGARALNVAPDDLDYEVREPPGKWLFGMGARPARVRLSLRPGVKPPPAPAEPEVGGDEALQVAVDTVRELLQRMGEGARCGARS